MGPGLMSFAELYEHAIEVCGSKEDAQRDILLRLERGNLVAFAAEFRAPGLTSSYHEQLSSWRIAEIPWNRPDEPIRFRWESWPEAIGVYVERQDVLRLWPMPLARLPQLPSDQVGSPHLTRPKVGTAPRGKGGRPPVHEWPKAAGFMAGYVIENDYPADQADLVRVLLQWFEQKRGKVPDRRDVERFVEGMYEARVGKL
jgi:hypothetical protein